MLIGSYSLSLNVFSFSVVNIINDIKKGTDTFIFCFKNILYGDKPYFEDSEFVTRKQSDLKSPEIRFVFLSNIRVYAYEQ